MVCGSWFCNDCLTVQNYSGTKVGVLWAGGSEEECGVITGVNKLSTEEKDQTYTVKCGGKGDVVGVFVKKDTGTKGWCIAELKVVYHKGILGMYRIIQIILRRHQYIIYTLVFQK